MLIIVVVEYFGLFLEGRGGFPKVYSGGSDRGLGVYYYYLGMYGWVAPSICMGIP